MESYLQMNYWPAEAVNLSEMHLPFIDFRAYKVGVNIPTNMQPSEPLEYTYVMKKGEEEFRFDQYPTEEGYEFVEMILKNIQLLIYQHYSMPIIPIIFQKVVAVPKVLNQKE